MAKGYLIVNVYSDTIANPVKNAVILNPNGYFGSDTRDAVRTFQKVFSLSQTGAVNYQTWYKISYILSAVTDMTNSIYN